MKDFMYRQAKKIICGLISFFLSFPKIRLQVLHRLLGKYPVEVLSTLSAHRKSATEKILNDLDTTGDTQVFEPVMEVFAEVFRDRNVPDRYFELIRRATGAALYYGQESEDAVLELMGLPEKGFFVDIGAHHPIRFSNTYSLYRRGWRGINIDVNPRSMEVFSKIRPDDINIEVAVSDDTLPKTLYLFEESAMNTFNRELADSYIASGYLLKEKRMVPRRTLAAILDEKVAPNTKINLFSIDVEGEEMGVLRSNDWNKYRPDFIVIEDLTASLDNIRQSDVVAFLSNYSYEPVSKIVRSIILRKRD